MKLQKFESFTPRNIEARQERMRLMKEKDLKDAQELVAQLNKVTSTFKGLKIEEGAEQFFIKKFIDCRIKIDQMNDENLIFFFDRNGNYLGEYNPKSTYFWISHNNVWVTLESKYFLSYDQILSLTESWIEKHFRLKSVLIFERLSR